VSSADVACVPQVATSPAPLSYRRAAAVRMVDAHAADELLELVSEANELTGELAPRSRCHAEGLLHRTVYLFLRDDAGRLLLSRRSPRKAVAPGLWDLSCAEHVSPGESYSQAACRGAREELAVQLAPDALTQLLPPQRRQLCWTTAAGKRVLDNEFVPLYEARHDGGAITADAAEVDAVRWVAWEDVLAEARAADAAARFTPWMLQTLRLLGHLPAQAPAEAAV